MVDRRTPVSRARSKGSRSRFPKLAHQLRYQVRLSGKQGIYKRSFHPGHLGVSRSRYKGETTGECQIHYNANNFVGVDEHRQIHQRLRDHPFYGTVGSIKVPASSEADPAVAH